MRRWPILALLGVAATAALAADNATLITPCATGCVTVRAKDIGLGVQSPVYILGDAAGNPIYGTAGTANTNVLTVQGIASMTPLTVTGTISATQGTSPWADNVTQFGGTNISTGTGASGAGIPRVTVASDSNILATQSGTWTVQQGGAPWSVTNQQSNNTLDYDTGAGVQTMTTWGIALPASGGAVAGGTATNPLRIDPTGTTTQPVSGTVTANAGSGTFTVSGTVTANQGGAPWAENITQFGGNAVVTGTGASGVGIPRVTVSNDSTVTANAGTNLNTSALALESGGNLATIAGAIVSQGTALGTIKDLMTAGSVTTNAPAYTTGQISPLSLTPAGGLRVDLKDTAANTNNLNVNLAASAATVTVSGTVAATESGTWTVQPGNTANTTPWLTSISQGGNTAAVNASSQLSVNCANCSGSGVSQQDATGFTFGTTNMVPIGGVYSSVGSVLPSGQAGAAQLTANRALFVNHRDSANQELGTSTRINPISSPVQVNVTQQIAQPATLYPATDKLGSLRVASIITDGNHQVSVNPAGQPASTTDTAMVVQLSPTPTLQCPFVASINQTGNTKVVAGVTGKFLHICSFGFISASAQNVSLVEGTGTTCGTNPTGLYGGSTASAALAANGGVESASFQITTPMQKRGDDLCILQSAAGNVSGRIAYGIY